MLRVAMIFHLLTGATLAGAAVIAAVLGFTISLPVARLSNKEGFENA